jgi:hypothetical protein
MPKTTTALDTNIDDYAGVRELKAQLTEAHAELVAAEAELNHLHGILNPMPTSSTHAPTVSELEALRAKRELPFAQERYLLAKAAALEVQPQLEQARKKALQALTAERNRARLPLLQQFAGKLDEAKEIGEQILAFDLETIRLGGPTVGHPFGELLDDEPYRMGFASIVRTHVTALEERER